MNPDRPPDAIGRGAKIDPPNRFESIRRVHDFEQLAEDDELLDDSRRLLTEYLPDNSKSLVSENDSPDIPFRFSVNPYRGCAHGCSYCYARPYHEYLGLNAGLDFETKILVKHDAPELFREFLARDAWQPELIAFSGVTDCYQPCERQFELTRRCLEVALEARQPIGLITKNALVTRDLDLLRPMAEMKLVQVRISITSLDQSLTREMEPRTSSPAARLRAIEALSQAGVPVAAMVAPIIPGLNDSEIPAVLQAAAAAGACSANFILLRLPLAVRPVFLDWLERVKPAAKSRVESRIRATRDGELTDAQFGSRMRGEGPFAEQIAQTFGVFAKKSDLDQRLPPLDFSQFRPPRITRGQLRLF